MSIQELEKAVTQLPSPELAQFTAWFQEYQANIWDKQIENDLEAGRLDTLLAEVDKEYKAGWRSRYEAFDAPALLAE